MTYILEVETDDDTDEAVCYRGAECPTCGENRIDYLAWDDDGEVITCTNCGTKYVPGEARVEDREDAHDPGRAYEVTHPAGELYYRGNEPSQAQIEWEYQRAEDLRRHQERRRHTGSAWDDAAEETTEIQD